MDGIGFIEGRGISTRVGILQADPQTELMTRLQAGDKMAVAEIDRLFGTELRLFCHRMVYNEAMAEDIVQDVLMTCCRAGQGLQPTESLRGWLYKITRNRSIDELRKLHPKARLSALQTSRQTWMNPAIPIDSSTTPAGRAVKQDRTRRVQLAIDGMDDELREVVIMYFFQGLSRGEVSEAIGLSLSGTKARLAKATRLLREKLRSLDDSSL
jgi:RNA polymerase sigma-70 factor (ECF subfamily)